MKISFSGADDDQLNCNSLKIPEETCIKENIKTTDSLISYIYKIEPRARKSFFKTDGTLANGTICLIDDEDLEIKEDKIPDYNSEIVFISTLHGV